VEYLTTQPALRPYPSGAAGRHSRRTRSRALATHAAHALALSVLQHCAAAYADDADADDAA
jgi:predicted N-acyltransferase